MFKNVRMKAVIGANFGDEGKGLMTDYFSSQSVKEGRKTIVVLVNGGSQRGHTVVTPEGFRHVFNHFGSGTLAGADTFLSKYFIINPLIFKKEFVGLKDKGLHTAIYIDQDCLVTTPFDMLINQVAEEVRGDKRHGSCGLGINETIKRNLVYPIKYGELISTGLLVHKLIDIRDNYVYKRLEELGIKDIPTKYASLLTNDNLIMNYANDVKFILNHAITTNSTILYEYESIIFEGSQGLLLDQNNTEYFPHLTPSNTGMQNVTEMMKELKYQNAEIEIVYVTRAYMTRHGPGKFFTETPEKPFAKILDMTNVPNQFQGTLRYGLLDVDLLGKTIAHDLTENAGEKYTCALAVTCLDQLDPDVSFVYDGKTVTLDKYSLLDIMGEDITEKIYISNGLTRDTIEEYNYEI